MHSDSLINSLNSLFTLVFCLLLAQKETFVGLVNNTARGADS